MVEAAACPMAEPHPGNMPRQVAPECLGKSTTTLALSLASCLQAHLSTRPSLGEPGPEAQIARLRYVLSHGCKEGSSNARETGPESIASRR